MKKSTAWILIIIIILLIVAAWYAFDESGSFVPPSQPNTASSTASTTNYFCASGTISAFYGSSSVDLTLSNGATMTLPQALSGSGVRYESGSGTTNDVVFESEGNNAFLMENNKTVYDNCIAGNTAPASTSGMETYTDPTGLFSFTYPSKFTLSGGEGGYTTSWRSEATSTGLELAVVTVPSSYEPNTNFAGATFTFGTSADPGAVSGCLTAGNGNPVKSSTVTINGVPFTELSYGDAGAGNIYSITSYRTVYNAQCYAAEYVVHSSNIQNYPPNSGVTQFNSSTIQTMLDGIARSVIFLE